MKPQKSTFQWWWPHSWNPSMQMNRPDSARAARLSLNGSCPFFPLTRFIPSSLLFFNSKPLNKVFWKIFHRFHLSFIHFHFVLARFTESATFNEMRASEHRRNFIFKTFWKRGFQGLKYFDQDCFGPKGVWSWDLTLSLPKKLNLCPTHLHHRVNHQ